MCGEGVHLRQGGILSETYAAALTCTEIAAFNPRVQIFKVWTQVQVYADKLTGNILL